jgi:diadenosine tetraphosphate (Ap4A) HIT family hydrolase
VPWAKKAKQWQKLAAGVEVVYEDEHVIAYHDPEDAPHESPREPGEIRVTVIPKEFVPSLMDLDVTHEALNAQMLFAVQQVAYKLGLQNEGFEVREHVLPPYQHRPGYALRIRAGKLPSKS